MPNMDMIAPTTSSLRSSVRLSQKFSETGSGACEAGAGFPFFRGAAFIPPAREEDFPFGFARGFDFLDEDENGVLSGIVTFSSIAQMVCFSF